MDEGASLTELFSTQLSAVPSTVVVRRLGPTTPVRFLSAMPVTTGRKLLMMLDQ